MASAIKQANAPPRKTCNFLALQGSFPMPPCKESATTTFRDSAQRKRLKRQKTAGKIK